jgi:hypothetical protein
MGGYGSGAAGWRGKVETCQVLDANELRREARRQLGPGQWANQIKISYQVRKPSGQYENVTLPVRIVNVPCRFGGTQPFFICPGVPYRSACNRRVVKLYSLNGLLLCRHCHGLAYASENEDAADRARRNAGKIKQRLGGSPEWGARFPPKPKGMHQRTYEKLWYRFLEAEERADAAWEAVGRS